MLNLVRTRAVSKAEWHGLFGVWRVPFDGADAVDVPNADSR